MIRDVMADILYKKYHGMITLEVLQEIAAEEFDKGYFYKSEGNYYDIMTDAWICPTEGGEQMVSEAQKRATARYDAENTKQVMLKLNVRTDEDILKRLEEVPNKQGYIKELIRRDMAK